MEDLLSKGMAQASEAMLAGCSAGGLAAYVHCDAFADAFGPTTKVLVAAVVRC